METSIAMPIRRNDEHTTTIYFLLIRPAQQHRLGKGFTPTPWRRSSV
jgi:hypothetical protein